ncbi:sensor histidine kinase [Microlunatus elymi]|uniref:sensor histidine kinase n=1 Tax=Microlunatus elymi TaxID=2596828 RepID=UPI00143D511D|nr:ATP-binding protein [Microlunatus elymi]
MPGRRSSARSSLSRAVQRYPNVFIGLAITFVALCTAALLEILGLVGHSSLVWVNGVAQVAGSLALAIAAGIAAWRGPDRRQRRAWVLLSIAGVFATFGNCWIAVTMLLGRPVLSSLGDLGYVIGGIFAIVGMAAFPAAKQRGTELFRMILDGVVIAGSVLLTVTVLALPSVLAEGQNPFTRIDSLAVMATDTILATVAALLLIRGNRSDRPVLALLALGFVIWAGTDLARWVLIEHGVDFFNSPAPLLWPLGYACLALAARVPRRTRQPADASPARQASPIADTILTFGVLLIAAASNAPSASAMVSPWIGGLWLILVIAVVVRQVILIVDNERLRGSLERRVSARTRELESVTRQSELMLNSVGDGIYGVDSEGKITTANPSAARALGYRIEDLIGRNAHDLFHAPQLDGTAYDYEHCYIAEAIESGATNSEEDIYVCADGRQIPVEVTASPLDSQTSFPGAVIVFRDITQRREVDRMKREFVSVVSHELRTPLTAIRGSLGLLADQRLGNLGPQAQRMINIALNSTERLGRLVNDILDIDRMESGSMPMDFRDHDAVELLEVAASQLRPIAAAAQVQVIIEPSSGTVNVDADRIVQTLVNLISNAIKYSPTGDAVQVGAGPVGDRVDLGPVDLAAVGGGTGDHGRGGHGPGEAGLGDHGSAEHVPVDHGAVDHEGADRDMIVFWVADRGRGIPADKLEQIFERFEQVDSSDRREMGGSGLGLSISRSIVERHGGRIWAESPNGDGAIFRFILPAARPDEDESDFDRSADHSSGRSAEEIDATAVREPASEDLAG